MLLINCNILQFIKTPKIQISKKLLKKILFFNMTKTRNQSKDKKEVPYDVWINNYLSEKERSRAKDLIQTKLIEKDILNITK